MLLRWVWFHRLYCCTSAPVSIIYIIWLWFSCAWTRQRMQHTHAPTTLLSCVTKWKGNFELARDLSPQSLRNDPSEFFFLYWVLVYSVVFTMYTVHAPRTVYYTVQCFIGMAQYYYFLMVYCKSETLAQTCMWNCYCCWLTVDCYVYVYVFSPSTTGIYHTMTREWKELRWILLSCLQDMNTWTCCLLAR